MPQVLQYIEGGNKSSNDLVVFLQGWPDNYAMWDWINWREQLSEKHLLFINFPNTNGKVDYSWGKDFPQIVQDIKKTIEYLNLSDKKKYLVGHDWGCFYSYMFDQKYPEYFSQLIMMDVPGIVQLKSPKQKLYVVLYQVYLIIAFMIGGVIGKKMTQTLAKIFKHNPPYLSSINSSQNYPYYYLWRNKILSALNKAKPYLKKYNPSVPVTYMYGSNKPFQFHGQRWMKLVEQSGGQIHKMQAGHWFMKKYAKFITDTILRRIAPKL